VLGEPVLSGESLQVAQDVGLRGEPARPLRAGLARERVEVRRHVAGRARVGVGPPDAADAVGAVEDRELARLGPAGPAQGHAQPDPAEPGADDGHPRGAAATAVPPDRGPELGHRVVRFAQHPGEHRVGVPQAVGPAVVHGTARGPDPGHERVGVAEQDLVAAGEHVYGWEACQVGVERPQLGSVGGAAVLRHGVREPARVEHGVGGRVGREQR
jgi:hypothetical protein